MVSSRWCKDMKTITDSIALWSCLRSSRYSTLNNSVILIFHLWKIEIRGICKGQCFYQIKMTANKSKILSALLVKQIKDWIRMGALTIWSPWSKVYGGSVLWPCSSPFSRLKAGAKSIVPSKLICAFGALHKLTQWECHLPFPSKVMPICSGNCYFNQQPLAQWKKVCFLGFFCQCSLCPSHAHRNNSLAPILIIRWNTVLSEYVTYGQW